MTRKRARKADLDLRPDLAVLEDLHLPVTRRAAKRARARDASFLAGNDPATAPAGTAPDGQDPAFPGPATAEATDAHAAAAAVSAVSIPEDAVVRRTKDGWRVGGDELPDLTCAMVLADLLAAESGAHQDPAVKPSADSGPSGETGRLRATVGQLEHALLTRIRVEQAIGVLAERHRIKPRQAFEQLRSAARSRGRRVIDIAADVVASASNPLLQLPDELSRPRSGPRRAPRQQLGAQ